MLLPSLYVERLKRDLRSVTYFPKRASAKAISRATERIFSEAEKDKVPLYLAMLIVDQEPFGALHPDVELDAPSVTILRSCLMRPEQDDWVGSIADHLAELNQRALAG